MVFDDAAGSVVKDSSGNRNTGTVMKGTMTPGMIDTAAVWETGHRGTALRLNGIDGWVNVPYSDSVVQIDIHNTVSISAWVFVRRLLSPIGSIALFQRHQAGTRLEMFFLGISHSGTVRVGMNFFYSDATVAFPTGRWTHVAMTHDGLTQYGFVNGKPVAFHDVGFPPFSDKTPFTMGAGINENDVTENLDGAIDEVRLYDVALNAEQIAALAWPGP